MKKYNWLAAQQNEKINLYKHFFNTEDIEACKAQLNHIAHKYTYDRFEFYPNKEKFFRKTPAKGKKKNRKDKYTNKFGKSTKPNYETVMAKNKFLPFIVENSSPLQIYTTLLARSREVNTNTVLTVFNAILQLGINTIRDNLKHKPETTDVFEYLKNEYIRFKLPDDVLKNYKYTVRWVNEGEMQCWDNKLQELDKEDVLYFFAVLALVNSQALEEYTQSADKWKTIATKAEEILSNLTVSELFHEDAPEYEFHSEADLIGYILYFSTESIKPPPVKAVFR